LSPLENTSGKLSKGTVPSVLSTLALASVEQSSPTAPGPSGNAPTQRNSGGSESTCAGRVLGDIKSKSVSIARLLSTGSFSNYGLVRPAESHTTGLGYVASTRRDSPRHLELSPESAGAGAAVAHIDKEDNYEDTTEVVTTAKQVGDPFEATDNLPIAELNPDEVELETDELVTDETEVEIDDHNID